MTVTYELVATWLAGLVLAAFLCLSVGTVGLSIAKRRADVRAFEARSRVRHTLFELQAADDPNWSGWIGSLTGVERDELESLLERYLRNVSGSDRRLYQSLARDLGMGERAAADLDQNGTVPTLRALARLSLLDTPIESERLFETCLSDRHTRAAAARLVEVRPDAVDAPGFVGTTLLLWDEDQPLTVEGLETLYDLNDGSPTPLLLRASRNFERWDPALLDQVCRVLGTCQTTRDEGRFEWVFSLFDDENPRVRAAAIDALRQQGWRRGLRSRVPFRALVTDESPLVRRRTYRVLAYWGDVQSRDLLEWATIDEFDSRCQLTAVRALASLDVDPARNHAAWPEAAWQWVTADLAVDNGRTLPTTEKIEVVGT